MDILKCCSLISISVSIGLERVTYISYCLANLLSSRNYKSLDSRFSPIFPRCLNLEVCSEINTCCNEHIYQNSLDLKRERARNLKVNKMDGRTVFLFFCFPLPELHYLPT